MRLFSVIMFLLSASSLQAQIPEQPNIIFIIVDDLNDYQYSMSGHPQISTPNLDRLADEGILFNNAFATSPGCAPSRASMLSGKDVNYTQVFDNTDYISDFRNNFTEAQGNALVYTLPEILKDSGEYFTFAINKVFHNPSNNDYDAAGSNDCVRDQSWNRMINFAEAGSVTAEFDAYKYLGIFSFGAIPNNLEGELRDYRIVDSALLFMDNYAAGTASACGRPFFLALGFKQPHSDRFIPEKYYPQWWQENLNEITGNKPYNYPADRYPINGFIMPPQPPEGEYADYYALPDESIAQSLADKGELNGYIDSMVELAKGIPSLAALYSGSELNEIITRTFFAHYAMNYMAAVQYIDHQIGRVMDGLEAHPELANNTIVLLVSDHGYTVGEKRHVAKWTLWETVNRIPMLMAGPGIQQGKIVHSPVSLLDVYPTLLELAGVDEPAFPDGSRYLDGASLLPVINNPELQLNRPVLSYIRNQSGLASCFPQISVRDNRWHMIRYQANNDGSQPQNFCDNDTAVYEWELYDIGYNRETDPEEWNNLAGISDYGPLMDFLQKTMYDSVLYEQTLMSVYLEVLGSQCLYDYYDVIELSSVVYDSNGATLTDGYQYRWTNSLTDDTLYGQQLTFALNDVYESTFNNNDYISFYLHVIDSASGIAKGFQMERLALHANEVPSGDFTMDIDSNTLEIISVDIMGKYDNFYWMFDSLHTSDYFYPTPYTFETSGLHTITLIINYGNNCSVSVSKSIDLDQPLPGAGLDEFSLFPNPSRNTTQLKFSSEITGIRLMDMQGRNLPVTLIPEGFDVYRVEGGQLATGNYILRIESNEHTRHIRWQVHGN